VADPLTAATGARAERSGLLRVVAPAGSVSALCRSGGLPRDSRLTLRVRSRPFVDALIPQVALLLTLLLPGIGRPLPLVDVLGHAILRDGALSRITHAGMPRSRR